MITAHRASILSQSVQTNKSLYSEKIEGGDAFTPPCCTLSKIGQLVQTEILNIEHHYNNVKVDKFIIMPNHIHLLLQITERINPFPTISYNISDVVGKFKAAVTRDVGKAFMPSEKPKIWQFSFYDHVVRGESDYREIWRYIENNPAKWKEDTFYIE